MPLRTCIACRTARPKDLLLRLARGQAEVHARLAEGDFGAVLDLDHRQAGRGSYVCPRRTCLNRLLRPKKGRGAVDAGGAERLESLLEAARQTVGAMIERRIQGARRAGQLHDLPGELARTTELGALGAELVTTHAVVRGRIERELALLEGLK